MFTLYFHPVTMCGRRKRIAIMSDQCQTQLITSVNTVLDLEITPCVKLVNLLISVGARNPLQG